MNIVDPTATSKLLTFLIVGIMICLVVIPSWLLNSGAFIHIDEDSIKAKYHWFGKIDCKLSDVVFAVARVNTLIIQLKDGKTHTIMGIKNSWPLASIIRRNMSFEVTEQPETLNEKLNNLKANKKNGLIYVCSGVALMFVIIFITVFLTGEREIHEFSNIDWTIFAIMLATEIATAVATFYFAGKTGKNNIPIEKLQYEIQRRIIETQPLLPGFVIAVYTDENYTGRITLFGYPNDSAVYYSVQAFASDYTLFRAYTSDVYDSQEELPANFETLIDITEKVLH
ncbi:MAG: hypothetical protein SOV91_01415 [Eubacteriales bacterium]|nr:hypothetical protein [Eubacteriales bacterium]